MDKQEVIPENNEETNNVQIEEDMYQQIGLIRLEDLDVISLEEIRRKLEKNL